MRRFSHFTLASASLPLSHNMQLKCFQLSAAVPGVSETRRNFSSASERNKRTHTCAAHEALTGDDPKNDPLTHSCAILQRARAHGMIFVCGCQKREMKNGSDSAGSPGSGFISQFEWMPWWRMSERLAGCLRAFSNNRPQVCHVATDTAEWQKRMSDRWLPVG